MGRWMFKNCVNNQVSVSDPDEREKWKEGGDQKERIFYRGFTMSP